MVESNVEPGNIVIDKVKNGLVTFRVTWNKEQIERTDSITNETATFWTYDEAEMWWILPQEYASLSDVQTYLDENYPTGECILNWAKGYLVSF